MNVEEFRKRRKQLRNFGALGGLVMFSVMAVSLLGIQSISRFQTPSSSTFSNLLTGLLFVIFFGVVPLWLVILYKREKALGLRCARCNKKLIGEIVITTGKCGNCGATALDETVTAS